MYRVEKVAKIIQTSLEEVFRNDKVQLQSAIVTIMHVEVSPNLGNAYVHLSFMSKENPSLLLEKVELNKKEIRHLLAARVRSKLQRVPELYFYLDTSVEEAFKLDNLLKNLK